MARKVNPPKIAAQTINRSGCIGALRCAVQCALQGARQLWLAKCKRVLPADCAKAGEGACRESVNGNRTTHVATASASGCCSNRIAARVRAQTDRSHPPNRMTSQQLPKRA